MDTTLHPQKLEKSAMSIAGLSIAICLVFSQNLLISAKDITGITGISPSIEYLKKQHQKELYFEKLIQQKYPSNSIIDVEKGVKHIKMVRYYNHKPVRINVVELSQAVNKDLVVEPAIASKTLASRSKISNIANRENAIVAINAGYFKPQTGVPLGTLMIDGKIYTGPIYDRVAIGFFEKGFDIARVKLNASVDTKNGGLKIDNINQPRMLSTHTIVYTPLWGTHSPPSPKYGRQLVVSNGKIIGYNSGVNVIPQDGYVIVGPEKQLHKIATAKSLRLNVRMSPEWKNVKHIISGGPYLVKDGEIFVDMSAQKLSAIGGRNPRTAIGYTKDNHLIMLTADGREGSSVGLTLVELANLMKEFGCVNAINLDGGGSTVMFIDGKIVNKPAQQGGIPLSHTLMVRKTS